MKPDVKNLDKKELEFFSNQRQENINSLIRLAEKLKDDETMDMWRRSRNVLKESIDKIFNDYEFFLYYAETKKKINNIK